MLVGRPQQTEAGERLPEAQARMVIARVEECEAIARRFRGQSHTREDLVGEGVTALVRSMRNYDPQLGVPFEVYSRASMRGGMTDAIRDRDRMIKPHRKDSPPLVRVKDAVALMGDGVSRTSDYVIAALTKMSEVDVRHYRDAPRIPHIESIFKPIMNLSHGGTMELIDVLEGAPDHAPDVDTATDVQTAIDSLDTLSAGIMRYRYGIDPYEGERTQEETAAFFEISSKTVQRREHAAMAALAEMLDAA